MKAEVTISNIYWNKKSLGGFFFRDQAYEALEELVDRSSMDGKATLDALDDRTQDDDIDEVEGCFYEMSVERLAEMYDIELVEGDEEDE